MARSKDSVCSRASRASTSSATLATLRTDASDDEDCSHYYDLDYDTDVTSLYQAIEEEVWAPLKIFLYTGYWPNTLFPEPESPKEQSRTWITRYQRGQDGTKEVRWSQLPIHAAIIFGAPVVIVDKLLELYPQSTRFTDDQNKLPLHLAFEYGASDAVLSSLLQSYPEAIRIKGGPNNDKIPEECAIYCKKKSDRDVVIQYLDPLVTF